ncbi:hypothetical protein M514_14066 [Trichuris suis]|uniref:Uncharacterized protein n=1 Tax=Trichuris suis TaxID=68888 RepID=A0A085LJB1_9BILA|nr:hypothetical protein M513_14066 [Trichuris suis]KFD59406.1 hypothetical protein M514_14066 [Trichuris suis]
MDSETVLPYGNDLQSPNNGVLRRSHRKRRYTVGIASSHQCEIERRRIPAKKMERRIKRSMC